MACGDSNLRVLLLPKQAQFRVVFIYANIQLEMIIRPNTNCLIRNCCRLEEGN